MYIVSGFSVSNCLADYQALRKHAGHYNLQLHVHVCTCTCTQLYDIVNSFLILLKDEVKDITFKETVDTLKSCALQNGKVPMVSIQYVCSNRLLS